MDWPGALGHASAGAALALLLAEVGSRLARRGRAGGLAAAAASMSALAAWNGASWAGYLCLRGWGDPPTRGLLAQLLLQRVPEAARLPLWQPLAAAAAAAALFVWASRPDPLPAYRGRPRLRMLGLAAAVGAHGAFLLAFAASLRREPVHALLLDLPPRVDLGGGDSLRRQAALEDERVRRGYDPGGARARSNVVVLVLDSLRADHLPMYGYARDTAPFLAGLHRQGSLQGVERAYSSCSESFCGIASILTGRPYPEIGTESLKFYELLGRQGYRVDLILAGNHDEFADLGRFYGPAVTARHLAADGPERDSLSDRVALRYVESLPRFDGTPRVMFFFLMSTHVFGSRFGGSEAFRPADVSDFGDSWNARDFSALLADLGRPSSDVASIVNHYDNGVLQGDRVLRRVFNGLKERGYLNDAILIVTADHGDALGEHNHLGHTYRLYDEDIRVPLLVWDSAGRSLGGSRFASHVDIAPTVFDRLGLPAPRTWKGASLFGERSEHVSTHFTRRGVEPCAAVLRGEGGELHKLIVCRGPAGPREELYELLSDPAESRELLAGPPLDARRARLLSRLRAEIGFFYGEVENTCGRADCVDEPRDPATGPPGARAGPRPRG